MRHPLPRVLASIPDALTAIVYLVAWVKPEVLGPVDSVSRFKRLAMLSGLAVFYMLFVSAFAAAFHSTWPIFAFGWLFLCRFFHLWLRPQTAGESSTMMGLWAVSVATYIVGGMLTAVVPLPALGMTPEFVAAMHLSGRGVWIERPYTVLAFGLIYFSIQAFAKYKATPEPATRAAVTATTV
jgi:hypothetical protein